MLQLINRDRATAGLAPGRARRRARPAQRSGSRRGHGEERLPRPLGHRRLGPRAALHRGRRQRHGARERKLLHGRAEAHARRRARHRPEERRADRGHVLPRGAAARRSPEEHPQAVAQDASASASRSRSPRRPRSRCPASRRSSSTTTAATPRCRDAMHVGDALHVEGTSPRPRRSPAWASRASTRRRPIPVCGPQQAPLLPGARRRTRCTGRPASRPPSRSRSSGARFSIDIPVSDGGKAGLYELSVWANVPGTRDLTMVSLRTFPAK